MRFYLIGLACLMISFSASVICDDDAAKFDDGFASDAAELNQGLTLKDKIKDSLFGGLQARAFHQYDIRRTQGHFSTAPFANLYQHYVALFIFKNNQDKERQLHKDDAANHAASGTECMEFFRVFLAVDANRVDKLEEFVKLDSCLGYLYDVDEATHQRDIQEQNLVAKELKDLIDNELLKSIYQQTKIDVEENEGGWGNKVRDCVADLFKGLFELRHQYDTVDCNNHHLQLLEEFASCMRGQDPAHPLVTSTMIDNDSYLKRIYELVRERAQKCYRAELELINRASRSDYAKEYIYRASNTIFKGKDLTTKRSEKDMMSPDLLKLLHVCQRNVDQEFQKEQQVKAQPLMKRLAKSLEINKNVYDGVDLKWFQMMFTSLQRGSAESQGFIRRLFKALRKYANEQWKELPKKKKLLDPNGVNSYTRFIDDLCLIFRSNSKPGSFDYATSIARIVALLEFQDVFGISTDKFMQDMVNQGRDTAPIYTGVYMCHILSLTEGKLEDVPNSNPDKKSYRVGFVNSFDVVKQRFWPASAWY